MLIFLKYHKLKCLNINLAFLYDLGLMRHEVSSPPFCSRQGQWGQSRLLEQVHVQYGLADFQDGDTTSLNNLRCWTVFMKKNILIYRVYLSFQTVLIVTHTSKTSNKLCEESGSIFTRSLYRFWGLPSENPQSLHFSKLSWFGEVFVSFPTPLRWSVIHSLQGITFTGFSSDLTHELVLS